ncbi:MAG: hypothetical protein M5R37_02150 [Melioribacteraceae bacterium]|nr:hypothetical protein [Melioribacteraceae bacterium]
MPPSKEELKKFQVAYEVIYNEKVSEQEAFEIFMNFSNLVKSLDKLHEEQLKKHIAEARKKRQQEEGDITITPLKVR